MKKLISSALCLLLVLTMVLPTFGIAVVKITGIKVDAESVSLKVGETKSIGVTYAPANTTQKLLSYSTSNKNVASVSADGTIVGTGVGSAVITVASKSNSALKATIKVSVKAKQKVTLTVEVFDRGNVGGTPADNNYWTNWIKTEYAKVDPNVTLKYVTCPRSQELNKLNVWMASNQAPDIAFTYDVNTVYNYYKNGGITRLDAAMDAFGQDLKTFLGKDVLNRGKYYGEQWSIPARRIMVARISTWIRQDWLTALGMKTPTTTAEYIDTMRAFKTKNPGKVGKVVPMGLTFDVNWMANFFIESYITDKSDYSRFISNGSLRFLAPGAKDALKMLNQMYNEGLLSSEFPLDRDSNLFRTDFSKGYIGSYEGTYDEPLRSTQLTTYIPELKKKIPGFDLQPIDPFKDKDGITTKSIYDPSGLRIIVPKTSEKKAGDAVKYLNWLTNKDVLKYLQFGEEGVNHVMKNGLPAYQAATGEKIMNAPNNIDYTLIVNGVMGGDPEMDLKVNSLSYGGVEDLFLKAVKIATTNSYVPPASSVPNDSDAKYANTLNEKSYEVYAKVITCKTADFEATWNKMVNEFMKVGGAEVLAARKAAYKAEFGN